MTSRAPPNLVLPKDGKYVTKSVGSRFAFNAASRVASPGPQFDSRRAIGTGADNHPDQGK
jgi:hypothetical protein